MSSYLHNTSVDLQKKAQLIHRFKDLIIELLDELIDQFPSEKNLVFARLCIEKPICIEPLLSQFCQQILPFQQMLADRNDKFFLDQNPTSALFKGADENEVNHFKSLWQQLDSENKEIIWQYFDCFLALANKYSQMQKH